MVDKAFVLYSKINNKKNLKKYLPTHAVKSSKLINPGKDKLAVLFPPWHGSIKLMKSLAAKLSNNGWSVLIYEFDPQILNPDEKSVEKSFEEIRTKIFNDLEHVTKTGSYQRVRFIGLSLGNVAMTMVADLFPQFTEADIVVGGDDLALCLWYGLRTSSIKEGLAEEHLRVRQLDKDWMDLAPKDHIKRFVNKPVRVLISNSDKIIPTRYQIKLKSDLINVKANVDCKYTRLGHYLSVYRYCRTIIDTN